jgi:anti-sigma regulatory factor (Ser/Thr protein kinase)
MHPVLRFTIPLSTSIVGAVRDRLVHQITELDGLRLDDDRQYALRLCASEAIANGIAHGFRGRSVDQQPELLVEADLDPQRSRLRITITDGGLELPAIEGSVSDLGATSGRGLAVIEGFADSAGWGQRTDGVGSVVGWSVWFELDVQLVSASTPAQWPCTPQPAAT